MINEKGLTEATGEDSGEKLGKNTRNHVHTTLERRGIAGSLEVDGEVVGCANDGGDENKNSEARAPDLSPLQHSPRDHGAVTSAVFPSSEDGKVAHGTNKKANDSSRVPGIFVAAPLESKQHHDGKGDEDGKARKIELLERQRAGMDFLLVTVIRNLDETEADGDNSANGKVEVEAYTR